MSHPSPAPEASDSTAGTGLDGLLRARLRRGLHGTPLAERNATVVFDGGDGDVWSIVLCDSRAQVRRGVPQTSHRGRARPDLVLRGAAHTLGQVASATISGIDAFLDGRLQVRGDLALALMLDGMFLGADERPVHHPRVRFVEALGVRTALLEAGPPQAPPAVLLHGLGATNSSMLPVLAELCRDHRVLAPDLPGFGASAAPGAPYSSAWFAAWLEALQGVTGSRGAVLVGNSLGGRIALEAGLAHPRSVRGLVLLTPSPAFRRLRQFVPIVRAIPAGLGRLPVPPPPHRLLVEAVRAMVHDPDRLPREWYLGAADEVQRVLRSRWHRAAFLAAMRQIYLEQAHGLHGFYDRLPSLEPPALFLWGEQDRYVPAAFARHVEGALPDARSIVLAECGHVPQFEQPELTIAHLRAFLAELPPQEHSVQMS